MQGMKFYHKKNIAHRDIKPENILVDMEVLNLENAHTSDIWIHFFLLLKSEAKVEKPTKFRRFQIGQKYEQLHQDLLLSLMVSVQQHLDHYLRY